MKLYEDGKTVVCEIKLTYTHFDKDIARLVEEIDKAHRKIFDSHYYTTIRTSNEDEYNTGFSKFTTVIN